MSKSWSARAHGVIGTPCTRQGKGDRDDALLCHFVLGVVVLAMNDGLTSFSHQSCRQNSSRGATQDLSNRIWVYPFIVTTFHTRPKRSCDLPFCFGWIADFPQWSVSCVLCPKNIVYMKCVALVNKCLLWTLLQSANGGTKYIKGRNRRRTKSACSSTGIRIR